MPATIHAFADTTRVGRDIARLLHHTVAPVRVHRFPDGESLVTVANTAAEAILVRSLDRPNEKLVEVLLAADALRRAGARRVTLIAPYLPYMRQDTVFHPGQPTSQQVIGALLARAFERVLTIAAHLHRTPTVARVIARGSRSLSPAAAIAPWLRRHLDRPYFLVGPDCESAPLVRATARAARVPWITATKARRGDRTVDVTFDALPAGREAVLIDTTDSIAHASNQIRCAPLYAAAPARG